MFLFLSFVTFFASLALAGPTSDSSSSVLSSLTASSSSSSNFSSRPSASLDPGCIVDIFKYECGNKFYPYKLDKEPAYYGVLAGWYEPGKEAYVGLTVFAGMTYQANRIQLDPAGAFIYPVNGPSVFTNDSRQIWYLFNDLNHHYTWVDSQNGEIPPSAIQVGEERSGFPILVGRILRNNNLVYVGVVVPFLGVMYYIDETGYTKKATTGYQVLVCKSSVENEPQYPAPEIPLFDTSDDPGCQNTWLPYAGDNAPITNGISAGDFECNTAFVGKALDQQVWTPGRIQTTPPAGFYASNGNGDIYQANDTFYLENNPNYTYTWVNYEGDTMPSNVVVVKNSVGRYVQQIGRINDNGHVKIGRVVFPTLIVPNGNGSESYFSRYELLACNPWPQYQCGINWKKYEGDLAPTIDGFNADSTKNGVDGTFIGRSCEINVGEVQMETPKGVYVLDDYTGNGKLDHSSTAEYLVKNSSYTYKWVTSRGGVQVANALEVLNEGHAPFYIGMTRIDDRVFVGKVRPGQGLFFADADGNQRTTNAYRVLTCFSSDESFGVWKKDECNNDQWFTEHWCPEGKEWDYEQMKCY